MGWDVQEIGEGRRREGRAEDERDRGRGGKKAPESISLLSVTLLGLVPGYADLWSRLSRNHFSCCFTVHTTCGATRTVWCGEVRCRYPVSTLYSTLPVLSHISVNCFRAAGRDTCGFEQEGEAERRRKEKARVRKRREEERGRRSPSPSPD